MWEVGILGIWKEGDCFIRELKGSRGLVELGYRSLNRQNGQGSIWLRK